jgi:hypothetical protein
MGEDTRGRLGRGTTGNGALEVLSGAMISMGRTLEKLGPALYSPECVEGGFSELRRDGVLRSSA